MLYLFPADTFVVAVDDYEKPYQDPIAVKRSEEVAPVLDGSKTTDFMGWTWCRAQDGRAGWTPDSWCEKGEGAWRLTRDFSAMELTVKKGDRLRALHGESGFLFCENADGDRAWIPDALVRLDCAG